jgi:choline dehydrogenase
VILSGGVFNSPQILKLSGIGPKAELKKFNIPVLVDLPGVGSNLQVNNEIGVIANAASDFVNKDPPCGNQNASDPCLAQWYEGKGPYTYSSLDSLLFKSKHSVNGERDILLWASPGAYRGCWSAETVNAIPFDGANTFSFSIIKIHPQTHASTVSLRSADPREVPDINFRFWEGNDAGADAELEALAEGIDFGRKIFDAVGAPLAPFKENFPCGEERDCDVKEVVRKQTWSHHATSTCAIGGDGDPFAVLDSRFRMRGTKGLRVVDGSMFPKTPGSFPVLPTFILSEKATAVILEETRGTRGGLG